MSSDGLMSQESEKPQQSEALAGFASILFDRDDGAQHDPPGEPACFRDLNLDYLVGSITRGRQEYNLAPFFYSPLTSSDAVAFRHEVLRDLEDPAIERAVASFADGMRSTRGQLEQAKSLHYAVQQQDVFLRAASTYVAAVRALAGALSNGRPTSRGLSSFARYLSEYLASQRFDALASEASAVLTGLARVTYRLHLTGGRVDVSRDVSEDDYAADVAKTFERFRQGQVKSHLSAMTTLLEMNHVEAAVTGLVAQLYPAEFASLWRFREQHDQFLDAAVSVFDREVQFYLAYLEFAKRLQAAGLSMCYPEVSDTDPEICGESVYDAALVNHLLADAKPTVSNDFHLTGGERILVVTGPNQGGKTTFARMVGQLTFLASLGLLVPGSRARLLLPDRIFTHFERGENLHDLTGALADDLARIREILLSATARSLIIVNEIFTSTSLDDALLLSTRVLRDVIRIDCVCVCVTFLDELASLSESTVSMVSQVAPDDPATRTFKVTRQHADGLAYAEAIARKYGLTYPSLKARLAR